jgi:glutathione S-transferase
VRCIFRKICEVFHSWLAASRVVGSHIGFGMMFGTLEKRPPFEKYWQRVSSRSGYLRAKELDDADAAKMKKTAS